MISVQKDKTSVTPRVPCGVGGWTPGPSWPSRPPPQGSIPLLLVTRNPPADPGPHRRVTVIAESRFPLVPGTEAFPRDQRRQQGRTVRSPTGHPARTEGAPPAFGPQGECGRLHGWQLSCRGRGWTAGAARSVGPRSDLWGAPVPWQLGAAGDAGGWPPSSLASFLPAHRVEPVACEVLWPLALTSWFPSG